MNIYIHNIFTYRGPLAKGTASVIVELIFKLEEEVPLDVEMTLFGLAGELNPVTTDTASANCIIESFILLYLQCVGLRRGNTRE